MPWTPLHTVTVEVVRTVTGPPDADGVPTSTEVVQLWGPCNVQPQSTSEQLGGMERVTSRLVVSGPPAPWIGAGDKALYEGREWRVDGDPRHYRAVLPHTEVTLIAWQGA